MGIVICFRKMPYAEEGSEKKKKKFWEFFRRRRKTTDTSSEDEEDYKRRGFLPLGRKKKDRGSKDVTNSFLINPVIRTDLKTSHESVRSNNSSEMSGLSGRRRIKAKVEASRELLAQESSSDEASSYTSYTSSMQSGGSFPRRSRAARTERHNRRMSRDMDSKVSKWTANIVYQESRDYDTKFRAKARSATPSPAQSPKVQRATSRTFNKSTSTDSLNGKRAPPTPPPRRELPRPQSLALSDAPRYYPPVYTAPSHIIQARLKQSSQKSLSEQYLARMKETNSRSVSPRPTPTKAESNSSISSESFGKKEELRPLSIVAEKSEVSDLECRRPPHPPLERQPQSTPEIQLHRTPERQQSQPNPEIHLPRTPERCPAHSQEIHYPRTPEKCPAHGSDMRLTRTPERRPAQSFDSHFPRTPEKRAANNCEANYSRPTNSPDLNFPRPSHSPELNYARPSLSPELNLRRPNHSPELNVRRTPERQSRHSPEMYLSRTPERNPELCLPRTPERHPTHNSEIHLPRTPERHPSFPPARHMPLTPERHPVHNQGKHRSRTPDRRAARQASLPVEVMDPRQHSSNLEEALNELEAIYKKLSYDEMSYDASCNGEALPTDDMAYRRLNKREPSCQDVREIMGQAGSYLLVSPTLSPPPIICHSPQDGEPDITYDDVVYRSVQHSNNTLKVLDPQPPFGIPLGPITTAPNTDYLHVRPMLVHSGSSPDLVLDDLAFRNLRKDHHSKKKAVRSMSANLSGVINRNYINNNNLNVLNNNLLEERSHSYNDIPEEMRLAQRVLDMRRNRRSPRKEEPPRQVYRQLTDREQEFALLEQLAAETRAQSDQIDRELRELNGPVYTRSMTDLLQEMTHNLNYEFGCQTCVKDHHGSGGGRDHYSSSSKFQAGRSQNRPLTRPGSIGPPRPRNPFKEEPWGRRREFRRQSPVNGTESMDDDVFLDNCDSNMNGQRMEECDAENSCRNLRDAANGLCRLEKEQGTAMLAVAYCMACTEPGSAIDVLSLLALLLAIACIFFFLIF